MKSEAFDYLKAFTRNIGWLTETEQVFLRSKKIAIAGLGGVGGIHLLTLVRLGFEQFHLADMDTFQLQNFNRQVGANLHSVDKNKVDVLTQMAKEINPNVKITRFNEGIHQSNMHEFLSGVDLYVDGLDFFVLDVRAEVFQLAYDMNIPAVTAGPLGMGTCYLVIMPGQMSFERYFQFKGASAAELPIRFLVGLNPKLMNRFYLVDPSRVNFNLEKGPSTIIACQLCAGVMGAEVLKIVLNRGPIFCLPRYHVFDPYLCKHHIGWMPFGNKNPIQKLKMHLMTKRLNHPLEDTVGKYEKKANHLEHILNLARWAPSGDNSQPWAFTILNENQIKITIFNKGTDDCYDFEGIPSLISGGCLLETIRIAASLYHLEMNHLIESESDRQIDLLIHFKTKENLQPDSLAYCITQRSVNRHHYKRRLLSDSAKQRLTEAIGKDFKILWFEQFAEKCSFAQLMRRSTKIRMTMPELFATHQKVFVSPKVEAKEGIPFAATGLNTINQLIMQWALKSWSRTTAVNKLGAIQLTQLKLDVLPALCCAAHFIIIPSNEKDWKHSKENHLKLGAVLQKFWLTATQLGLAMHPNITPLILKHYQDKNTCISQKESVTKISKKIANTLRDLTLEHSPLFLGRIGYPKANTPKARSSRKNLTDLLIE